MDYEDSTEKMMDNAVAKAMEAGYIKQDDLVVITAGVPAGLAGSTNMMKVHQVGSTILTGVGVSDHAAKGPVCVCRTVADMKAKFRPGMILVVPHTNNDMMPYLRQAAGIVAEENGLGSHAAVVGLSLEKPVIVGAQSATRVLQDGMKIALDCTQGVVKKLVE